MVAAFCDSTGNVTVKYSSDLHTTARAVLTVEAFEWGGAVTFNRSMTVDLDVRHRHGPGVMVAARRSPFGPLDP